MRESWPSSSALLGDSYTVEGLAGTDVKLPDEGTASYRANAETKAVFAAAATGRLTLGDDSGIEAFALGGMPRNRVGSLCG